MGVRLAKVARLVASELSYSSTGPALPGGTSPKRAISSRARRCLTLSKKRSRVGDVPRRHPDVNDVARAVVYMASLPLDANVQLMTVMATSIPYIGRG